MLKQLTNGLLVIFEGIDGVGKTTQLKLAQQWLENQKWPVVERRNLGGTPIGEALRQVIKSSTPRPPSTNLYISAAIQAALIEQIQTDRQNGQLILMDRGPFSLAAYEAFGSQLDEQLVWPHVDQGMVRLQPELVIIYSADVQSALERARQSSKEPDYFESKPLDYFERVAKGYAACAERYPAVQVIDANQSIEAIQRQTQALIEQALAKAS